jgi:hypothetical protein
MRVAAGHRLGEPKQNETTSLQAELSGPLWNDETSEEEGGPQPHPGILPKATAMAALANWETDLTNQLRPKHGFCRKKICVFSPSCLDPQHDARKLWKPAWPPGPGTQGILQTVLETFHKDIRLRMVCSSNVKPTFFQDRRLTSSKKSNKFVFETKFIIEPKYSLSKVLVQKLLICSISKKFLRLQKFCFVFRNLWTKSKRFGFVSKFLD